MDCSPPGSSVLLGVAYSLVHYEELHKCESHMIWGSISGSSFLLLLCFFKGKEGGCAKSDLGGWVHHVGQVRDCRRSLPGAQGLRGKDHKEGERRKANKSSLPNSCVWGQAQSGPGFRVEAKEPPWINELQGQLGIQLCQKHPLTRSSEPCVW